MELYHGTSSIFGELKEILPPSATNNLREEFRDKLNDYIFLTNSTMSAFKYAQKCCSKFGGNPIIYLCEPNEIISQNGTEFICDYAKVIKLM